MAKVKLKEVKETRTKLTNIIVKKSTPKLGYTVRLGDTWETDTSNKFTIVDNDTEEELTFDIKEAIPVIALLMGTVLAGMVHFGTGNPSSKVDHDIDNYNRIVKKRLEDLLLD